MRLFALATTATLLAATLLTTSGCDDADRSAVPTTDTMAAADTAATTDTAAADATPPDTAATATPLPDIAYFHILEDLNPDPKIVEVNLRAETKEVIWFDDILTAMYAYNGVQSGPMLQARVGDLVIVHFTNDLAEATTIHWHGLRISDQMDGNPRIQNPVQPGDTFTYRFTVNDAGNYWYHPHVRSNEQVEKGLYGPIVVHEAQDTIVDAQHMFVMDDILLTDEGMPAFLEAHPEIMHGRAGNVLLVNGQVDPVQRFVNQGQVERWRIVNTANARTMKVGIEGASWRVMGSDGGLIEVPYSTERLTVPVGQRYDLEVRFDSVNAVTFQNFVLARNELQELVEVALPMTEIEVRASTESTEAIWPTPNVLPQRTPTGQAAIEFSVGLGPNDEVQWMLNGQHMPMEPLFIWQQGDVIDIKLTNTAGPEHPFHLHGQFFELLMRNGQAVSDEPGLKDTVLVPGVETATIRAYLDNPGRWMAHCHILEHAELGMMAEIVVEPHE